MFCTKCGTRLQSGVDYCGVCGQPISQGFLPGNSPVSRSDQQSQGQTGKSMSSTIYGFAAIGAVVAFIPFASYLLIFLELYLLYKIVTCYGELQVPTFAAVATGLVAASVTLKSLALTLNVFVGTGQIANSLVAFGFIVAFGLLAQHHYSKGPASKSRYS
jgi:uncharacterized membrane protein